MELRLYGQRYHLDQEHPRLVLGRTHFCDIQVLEGPVSREHAVITLKDGHLVFEDKSTNGSYVRLEGANEQHVHHQTLRLHGKGVISLGFPVADNAQNLIRFEAS
jgi:pSer/pThr/pTyr-binding forkhead associated (FHA) protein